MQSERLEWHQFQSDLQVAVSVADRLRVESEQALSSLQESHRAVEEQLSQALSREQEKEKELETLRAEHRDLCLRLSELTVQQQQERAELDALRNASRVTDVTDCDNQTERRGSEDGRGEDIQVVVEESVAQTVSKNVEMQEESESNRDVETKCEDQDPEDENGSGYMHLTGKGVAEGYLRSLAALEKKKEEGLGQRDPRRIVMLSERSW